MFADPSTAGRQSAIARGVIGNSVWGRSMLLKRCQQAHIGRKAQRYYILLRKKLGLPKNTPIKTEAWRYWDGNPETV
jgi:hypothetical protein